MIALALECCTETCSVAACEALNPGWRVWWRTVHRAGQQLALLTPLLEELLDVPRLRTARFDRVGVTRGPGTFTGVRIGLATARTLAQVWNVEVVAVDTLDAIACNRNGIFPYNDAVETRDVVWDTALTVALTVAMDARKGELFAASYAEAPMEGWPHPLWGPSAIKPIDLPPAELAAGNGLVRYPDLPAPIRLTGVEAWPSAAHVALAAAGAYRDAPPPQPWTEVAAFYLRSADAQIPRFMS